MSGDSNSRDRGQAPPGYFIPVDGSTKLLYFKSSIEKTITRDSDREYNSQLLECSHINKDW